MSKPNDTSFDRKSLLNGCRAYAEAQIVGHSALEDVYGYKRASVYDDLETGGTQLAAWSTPLDIDPAAARLDVAIVLGDALPMDVPDHVSLWLGTVVSRLPLGIRTDVVRMHARYLRRVDAAQEDILAWAHSATGARAYPECLDELRRGIQAATAEDTIGLHVVHRLGLRTSHLVLLSKYSAETARPVVAGLDARVAETEMHRRLEERAQGLARRIAV